MRQHLHASRLVVALLNVAVVVVTSDDQHLQQQRMRSAVVHRQYQMVASGLRGLCCYDSEYFTQQQ
eukprot:9781-Heterococcus_DN1.PRE.3